jgi:hypothetical protein
LPQSFPDKNEPHRGNFRTQEPGLHNKITGLHPYTCIVHLSTYMYTCIQAALPGVLLYTRDMHV